MSEEYLDLIDEYGNLTGEKELRSIVHEKGLWHQTVHIYFFRKNDLNLELLVHLRSKEKSTHPNRWDTRFGGHVETGQTMDEAALREVEEEVGLKISNEDLITSIKRNHDGVGDKEITQVYFYNFTEDTGRLSFNDGEVQMVKWMSFLEIEESIMAEPQNWTGSVNGLRLIESELIKNLS